MKEEKLANGKRHKTRHQLQRPAAKTTATIRKMLLSCLNHAGWTDGFAFSLMALAIHMKHCLSILFLSFQLLSPGIFSRLIRKSS